MVFRLGCAAKVGAQCCTALTLFQSCGRIATLFDGFRDVALVLGVEEGNLAVFVEIGADCVRDGGGPFRFCGGFMGGSMTLVHRQVLR